MNRASAPPARWELDDAILRRALDQGAAAVSVVDPAGRFRYVNQRFMDRSGYPREEILGHHLDRLDPGDAPGPCSAVPWTVLLREGAGAGILRHRHRDGRIYWERATVSPVRNAQGDIAFFLTVAEDVDPPAGPEREHNRLVLELHDQARRDPLTALLNRRGIEEELHRLWRCAERQRLPLGLLWLDVDRFKRVNDTYGHAAGDRVLHEGARCLQDAVRDTDRIGRQGGDEFLVILPGTDAAAARSPAERLLSLCRAHVFLAATHRLAITFSAGAAALCPEPGTTPDRLLSLADRALYAAKQGGRDRVAVVHADPADPARPT